MGKLHIYVVCGGLERCSTNNFCPLYPGDLNPGNLSKRKKKVDKLAVMICPSSFLFGLPTEGTDPGHCAVLTLKALEDI